MSGSAWPGGKAYVLTSWTIQNVEERNKKPELEQIEQFPNEYGCALDAFLTALNGTDAKTAARQLKEAGYQKITLGWSVSARSCKSTDLNCSRRQ